MKTVNMPQDFFELLPTQQVEACELQEGDMACIHQRWSFVLSSKLDNKFNNGGHNQIIELINGGGYLPPNHKVNIILRSIVAKDKVKDIIATYRAEQVEHKKWREEEEKEERERLREMRDQLNRELRED